MAVIRSGADGLRVARNVEEGRNIVIDHVITLHRPTEDEIALGTPIKIGAVGGDVVKQVRIMWNSQLHLGKSIVNCVFVFPLLSFTERCTFVQYLFCSVFNTHPVLFTSHH